MTRPGIEPRSLGPLAKTLTIYANGITLIFLSLLFLPSFICHFHLSFSPLLITRSYNSPYSFPPPTPFLSSLYFSFFLSFTAALIFSCPVLFLVHISPSYSFLTSSFSSLPLPYFFFYSSYYPFLLSFIFLYSFPSSTFFLFSL